MKFNDQQLGFIVRYWGKIKPSNMQDLMGSASQNLSMFYKKAVENMDRSYPYSAQEIIAEYLISYKNLELLDAFEHAHEICSKLQDNGFDALTLMDNSQTGPVHGR